MTSAAPSIATGAPGFKSRHGQPHPVGEGQIKAKAPRRYYIIINSNDPVFFQYKFTIIIQLIIYRSGFSTAAAGVAGKNAVLNAAKLASI
jgi:hypothetical protein